jgi:glutathione peroxidase-family protein
MSVATSGWCGKNYGTEIRIVKKQKTQGKNGVNVYLNLARWLVMKSRQTLGIKT